MNVAGLFSMQRRARGGPPSAWASALLASALCGCADLGRVTYVPPVNPESPVAAQVSAASKRVYPFPRFRDVPPKPTGVRTPAQFKTAVVDQVRCRRAMDRWVAEHPQMNYGTEQFAAGTRAIIPPLPPPPVDETQAADALAAKLRAYAAPPPEPVAPALKTAPAARATPAQPAPALAAQPAPPAAQPTPPPAPQAVQTAQASAPPMPAPLPDPLLTICR